MARWFCLALLCALVGCGDLPEPFRGNPGATARRLAQPPTPRLAVPAPADALLPDESSQLFAEALAAGLQAQEVPAVAAGVRANDWQLVTTAEQRGGTVVPKYRVVNPQGEDKGNIEGAPVETQAWAQAKPDFLISVATDAAPRISDLLTSIQTSILRADPNSLYNRPAKVQLLPVTGAPGDGNAALTRQMKTRLAALGPLVQDSASDADFIIKGEVLMVRLPNAQQRVEIVWTVRTGGGDERGKVMQLNEIPAGTLDRYWGDVAIIVATEAAGGVNDVIARQSGREPGQPVRGQAQKPLVEGQKAGGEPVR